MFKQYETLGGTPGKYGYNTRFTRKIMNDLAKTDPRWTQFLDEEKVQTAKKYKTLFKWVCNK